MSIRTLSRSASPERPAFTLVELLVVIAIIALLMSILLPSLNCAREQSRGAACGVLMRSLGTGLNAYASENDDWIPGVNTSGVATRAKRLSPVGELQNSKIPVQPYDWMTPIIAYDTQLPSTRADRFQLLQERYRCPSQATIKSVFYPRNLSGIQDAEDFRKTGKEWTSLSYLMPVYFQFWGESEVGQVLASMDKIAGAKITADGVAPSKGFRADWNVVVPSYKSRISKVGNTARKIAVADGTRYLDRDGLLDHDVSAFPTDYGSFTAGGGFWSGDTAYGVRSASQNWAGESVSSGSPSNGENLWLSYRHACNRKGSELSGTALRNQGRVNALFWDGHVSPLGDRQSREPYLWYPKGAVVRTTGSNMTAAERGEVIP